MPEGYAHAGARGALRDMWVWNAVMPDLFGLQPITWFQAAGLSLLCTLLLTSPASKNSD